MPIGLPLLAPLGFVLAVSSSAFAVDAATDRIAALTKGFAGTVVVYARNLQTGREVAIGADDKVRTAFQRGLRAMTAGAAEGYVDRIRRHARDADLAICTTDARFEIFDAPLALDPAH